MRLLRSTWLLQCTALLLLGAMLPAFFAPSSHAASGSTSTSYSDWIRSQLRVPVDAAFDRALEEAMASRTHSFEAFAAAFLTAYESHRPGESAARAFVDRDISRDALIAYLQRRYTEIGGEAVLLRLRIAAASISSVPSTSAMATVLVDRGESLWKVPGAVAVPDPGDVVAACRPATPARPQGP